MFALPGTPVLFYGEEIGLGDDQALEAREAVRTGMQWSAEPGGGFSTAARAAMERPPVQGGPFGYERLNVQRQREDPGSFLNWMERLIRTRREWPEIGWGAWRILPAGDDAVLALAMQWQGSDVVSLHNMAARQATVQLKLPGSPDRPWQHILGPRMRGRGPRVEGAALDLTLGPHGYHWFGRRGR